MSGYRCAINRVCRNNGFNSRKIVKFSKHSKLAVFFISGGAESVFCNRCHNHTIGQAILAKIQSLNHGLIGDFAAIRSYLSELDIFAAFNIHKIRNVLLCGLRSSFKRINLQQFLILNRLTGNIKSAPIANKNWDIITLILQCSHDTKFITASRRVTKDDCYNRRCRHFQNLPLLFM